MNKKDRQIVFNKFGGRCAYCGCELVKGWQLDHLQPVNRLQKTQPGYYRNRKTKQKVEQRDLREDWFKEYEYIDSKLVFDKMQHPERDTVENSMPACASCNNYKNTFGVELFREQIGLLVERLNRSFTQYKIAKRFGLIKETGIEVKFYFETFSH